ncbi:unnamed protein product [Sphenostylis stenocarpa]|uniref:MLO-like protein n=1 Tax=Sphenostylis stenocarpa TaxID=92480 RepID=A0AA86W6J3_9FABA|nr:unnamed protein product [Sphenostylis stenocarpa]
MDMGKERSLEETPTWAVAVCCFFFLVISLIIEFSLHKLAEDAVILTELTSASTSDLDVAPATNESAVEGMVSLISSDGVLQLNIFISFLAVFHILFCTFTMCLGKAKKVPVYRSNIDWEASFEILELSFSFALDGSFMAQSQKMITLLYEMGSLHNFNFKKFLSRTYDEDFEKVTGIRYSLWSDQKQGFGSGFSPYFSSFLVHMFALLAGTKLQVIITKMCVDSCKENPVIKGRLLVTPSDAHFWFHRPECLLHLLKFILIQNSFQLAFFTWTWYEYGPRSCFNRENEDIGIRVAMGIAVQLLCGYVTLPLYALVTQMGSSMRREIFTESVYRGLKNWHKEAKQSLSKNSKHSDSVHSKGGDNAARGTMDSVHTPDNVVLTNNPSPSSEEKRTIPTNEQDISSHSTKITATEEENPKIITRGTYDGEISFGSSWKNVGSSRGIGEIVSITEEDDAETFS